MNAAARRVYFTQVWPAAAKALGCARSDDEARKAVTREAMRLVRGPQTDSIKALGPDEVTALFCYCRWLARKDDLRMLSAWMNCQEDYRAYNRVLQGHHYRDRAGYGKRGKLERGRFGNRATGGMFDESRMTAEEAEQYLMTMRARAQGKERKGRKQPVRVGRVAAPVEDDNCPF